MRLCVRTRIARRGPHRIHLRRERRSSAVAVGGDRCRRQEPARAAALRGHRPVVVSGRPLHRLWIPGKVRRHDDERRRSPQEPARRSQRWQPRLVSRQPLDRLRTRWGSVAREPRRSPATADRPPWRFAELGAGREEAGVRTRARPKVCVSGLRSASGRMGAQRRREEGATASSERRLRRLVARRQADRLRAIAEGGSGLSILHLRGESRRHRATSAVPRLSSGVVSER